MSLCHLIILMVVAIPLLTCLPDWLFIPLANCQREDMTASSCYYCFFFCNTIHVQRGNYLNTLDCRNPYISIHCQDYSTDKMRSCRIQCHTLGTAPQSRRCGCESVDRISHTTWLFFVGMMRQPLPSQETLDLKRNN